MGLETILIAVAAKVGAPLVKSILEKKIGGKAGEIGGAVIDAIAGKADVTPDELPRLPTDELEEAVRQVEAEAPEMIAAFVEQQREQNRLQLEEMKTEPAWTWAWRPAGMWMFNALVVWARRPGPARQHDRPNPWRLFDDRADRRCRHLLLALPDLLRLLHGRAHGQGAGRECRHDGAQLEGPRMRATDAMIEQAEARVAEEVDARVARIQEKLAVRSSRLVCDCGEEISPARREAYPNARDCIECARRMERMRRRA
ncbi:TraR/DksA C4-type zinc finger protein [Mesorhizobium sp. J428]|uniref:TraR/DksA C4-type zinc finger protein n=1 Tax=Mesorhizobium sp. J428 TaxID=2898440 RepID=UPI00215077AD|nr:TraR/DksA C4-type zinc finger protein [Mesorhizobium sp. J428]MCR5855979.1 TraR/DksA C4-type zinc finger protein [Mesorhizobium sp. J428]